MKAAVIRAHPAPDSLNAALAKACAEALTAQGHQVIVRDLYAMGFDPCLRAEEIPGPGEPRFGPDVLAERERLADVDLFVLVYPVWFNGPPAILKGYVDRVFGMGFGFTPAFGGNEPRLTGRRLLSFTTSGSPDHWMRDTHVLHDLERLFDHHLAGTCGLSVVDHVHFGGMVSDVRPDVIDEVLLRVAQTIRDQIPAGGAA
ncbi:NAD(P)H-dependent oxidoreductase [Phenylobacterium sp. J426]|uniref:NAD(P)H-dependent oxidoreductase n=1 Tax=Phenylobacterium sp. J426 TaxID=2898439 RepID=UPI00215108E8|nr:NAD(P)H-dependent oxidoreductase [Phenylobacterium sp. J426]MCR5875521.1 NAD(P)H-dependent oxidoreductase [Phenylobacterium sp. J426]